ncbi:MAG: DnaA N-terminal domain-containing protein [Planctomycetota bacterium]
MLELLKQSWSNVQDRLRKAAGDAAYDAWLGDLRPVLLERGVVYIEAKSRMVKDRVQRLFRPLLQEILSGEIGTAVQVELQDPHQGQELEQLEVSPQQPIVDDANKTAWLVLKNLAGGRPLPGTRFFFHGPSGVGKTFLLRSFRDATGAVTFTLPDLLRAFQAVHRDGRVRELQAELLAPKVLVLDELHRIADKPRLQAFIGQVLDRRDVDGKATVMASRWHPKEIRDLDQALCAAMMGGFVAKIDPPGPVGRLRYLRALEGAPSRNGRATAVEGLAQRLNGTFPELRAAWARSRDAGLPRRYLELIDPARTFARLRDRVCERLDVTAADLLGKGQGRQLSLARKVLAFLCVQEGLSRAEVGRFLSARTRAAVSYMTRSLAQDMAQKPQVRALVEGLL